MESFAIALTTATVIAIAVALSDFAITGMLIAQNNAGSTSTTHEFQTDADAEWERTPLSIARAQEFLRHA